MPDWMKVNFAAAAGVGTPWLASLFDRLGPVLDLLTKVGQVGVAAVTIIYIIAKWRKVRGSKK